MFKSSRKRVLICEIGKKKRFKSNVIYDCIKEVVFYTIYEPFNWETTKRGFTAFTSFSTGVSTFPNLTFQFFTYVALWLY